MKKHRGLFVAAMVLLYLGRSSAQAQDPFLTMPISASVTFGTLPLGAPCVTVNAAVGILPGQLDPLDGSVIQVVPQCGPVGFVSFPDSRGNRLAVYLYGSGYLLFQDANGGGVGWHIVNELGWTVSRVRGSLVMEIDLEGPFWLGDPPASVSPTLVQMKSAWTGKLLLPLQTPQGTSLGDLVNVGVKGKFGNQPSVTFAAPGYLYLFQ